MEEVMTVRLTSRGRGQTDPAELAAGLRYTTAYVDTILKGATPGVELAPGPRRRAARGTPRRQHTCSGAQFAAVLSPREHPASAYPAQAARRRLALLGPAGRYLNWGVVFQMS